jgi:hypothetical protein
MVQKIRKHWDLAIVLGAGLAMAVAGLIGIIGFPNVAYGDAATTVVVTATVQEYLTFTANATSVTLTPDLIDNTGVGHIASSTDVIFTLNTTSADGYSITVYSANNGLMSGGNYIQLSTATGTAQVGTSTYGIQATSSDMTVVAAFKYATTTDNIGKVTNSSSSLATKSSPGSNQKLYVRIKASASSTQPSGSYTDTLTFTGVASP